VFPVFSSFISVLKYFAVPPSGFGLARRVSGAWALEPMKLRRNLTMAMIEAYLHALSRV
jgi:hypothetical protein